jgi:hypothetical protein
MEKETGFFYFPSRSLVFLFPGASLVLTGLEIYDILTFQNLIQAARVFLPDPKKREEVGIY